MPDTVDRAGPGLDAGKLIDSIDSHVEQLRQAVYQGAMLVAVDLTAFITYEVARLAVLCPEET